MSSSHSCQCSSTDVSVENSCTTELKSHNVVYSWTIKDFDFHEVKGDYRKSPTFSATTNDEYKWYLLVKPNGNENDSTGEHVSVYLYSRFAKILQPVFVKCTVDFFKQENMVFLTRFSTIHKFSSESNRGWGEIPKKEVLSKNQLKMRCHVQFSHVNEFRNLSHEHKSEIEECNARKYLTVLFENQECSDVIISVKTKDYPLHKCILAASSPVFSAMFKHDLKENQLNRVLIEDIDENVMFEMFRYIYTGKCENLETLAEGLLAAADKYALDGLKIICSRKFRESLSVENAANILLLSEMHQVNDLKAEVIKFIVGNSKEVFATDGWKNMLTLLTSPLLLDEVCRAMAHQ